MRFFLVVDVLLFDFRSASARKHRRGQSGDWKCDLRPRCICGAVHDNELHNFDPDTCNSSYRRAGSTVFALENAVPSLFHFPSSSSFLLCVCRAQVMSVVLVV